MSVFRKIAAKIGGQFAANDKPAPGAVDMASVSTIVPQNATAPATMHWLNMCIERGKREVFSEVICMNPGVAAELLKRNPDNRPIKWKSQLYAADMRAGRWTFNGEPIILSREGLVNDGQHRLTAIIESNTTQDMMFVFGLDRDSRLTVDQGAARGAGDYLGMGGRKNCHNLAAIAKGVLSFEAGEGRKLIPNAITNADIMARCASDDALEAATDYAVSVYRYTRTFAAPKIIGTAFYLLSDVNPMDARIYMDRVCIGEGLKRGDPAYAVRDALLALGKTSFAAKLEVILRGWAAHRTNRTLKLAKVLGSFPALV